MLSITKIHIVRPQTKNWRKIKMKHRIAFKRLEKNMTFTEATTYISEHNKYRFLTVEESRDYGVFAKNYFFSDIEYKQVKGHLYEYQLDKARKLLSSHFKFNVYVTHTNEYQTFMEEMRVIVKEKKEVTFKTISKILKMIGEE
ncbi:hypothetical protein JHD46_05490 [Sulfurimonas sp. SAG-AH-194-C20]|nr:hypothetical protein [Sulfurimonas sp. SAG-AH-194-C20]MDF1879093.1 hypothetical protein [Sulfurimonas sp. SAG-AH-194-C20]